VLIRAGRPYASRDGRELASELTKAIQEASHYQSLQMAEAYRPCPTSHFWRNLTTTAIAPTGSLSIIANCSLGIEPLFARTQQRTVLDGQTFVEHSKAVQEVLDAHQARGVEELPRRARELVETATEILPEDHVRMQAAIQQYVDNGVSKTVNLPQEATVATVRDVIDLAYQLGCKGLTVYRDRSREEQVICSLCS